MRKERYIEERIGKKGKSYRVKLKGYTKTFSEDEYGSPKLALKYAIQYRNDILYGDFNPCVEKKITVNEIYQEIFNVFPVRIETRRKMDIMYRKYISHKDKDIKDIKADDILYDLNKMIEIATNDTIKRVFSIWRKIIHTAIYKEYITRDCTLVLKPPKSHSSPKFKVNKVIDRQLVIEMENLARTKLNGSYDRDIVPLLIETLYLTGMRPCEALALERKDIKKDHLEIRREVGSSMDKRLVARNCKTELSARDIPLTSELKSILKQAQKLHDNEIIFCNEFGEYYDSTLLGDKLHKIGKNQGYDFNLYSIRHLVSTELTLANVDERTRIEIFGHTNIATTLGYARSNNELKKDALENKSSQKVPKSEK